MDENLLQPQTFEVISKANDEAVAKAKEDESSLASVVFSPAWEEVRKILETKGSDKAICEKIRPLIADATVSNEQLGTLTRSVFMAAKEINETLEMVIETVKAHAEQ